MFTWQDVLAVAEELPEVEESTAHGRPALRVRGKFVCSLRTGPDALVVRCDLEEKPFLLEARPDVLFETPHYEGHAYVLVRLDAPLDDVRELLTESWLLAAPRKLAESFSRE